MPYRVTVVGEIARLRAGDAGSRNVRINKGTNQDRVLTFNRMPTYLETLPPEVARDSMLVVREISEDEMQKAGGRLLDLERAASAGKPAAAGGAVMDDEDDFEEEPMEQDTLVKEGTEDPDKVNQSNTAKPPRKPRKPATSRKKKA
jgi:hypothetical protein